MAAAHPRQKAQFFISYSRRDRLAVDRVVHDLTRRSYHLWIDVAERGIEPGEDWRQELVTQMSAAEAVIACVSPEFLTSPYCREEIEQAKRENKPIYPVIVRALNAGQSLADMGLDHLQFVDLTQGHDEGLRRLMLVLPRPVLPVRAWTRRAALVVGVVIALLAIVTAGAVIAPIVTGPTPTPIPPTAIPVMTERVGVAVAYFAHGDDIDDADARSLIDRFSGQLEAQLRAAAPDVGFRGPAVVGQVTGGKDVNLRAASALTIATTYNARIVVYGVVSRGSDNRLTIQPEYQVIPGEFAAVAELRSGGRFGKTIQVADRQEAEDELITRTQAIALVLEGLGDYINRDYDQALVKFADVQKLDGWEDRIGEDVIGVMVGNVLLASAVRDFETCGREAGVPKVEAAVEAFTKAEDAFTKTAVTGVETYIRPYSGLASANYLLARWTPEESVQDGKCFYPTFDSVLLDKSLAYIDDADKQFASDQSLLDQPFARSALLLNKARANYGYCNIAGLSDQDYEKYCGAATRAINMLIALYNQDAHKAVIGPFVSVAYGMLGDIEQFSGEFDAAIKSYDAGLQMEGVTPYNEILFTGFKGDAYINLKQYETAAGLYQKAADLADSYSQYGYERWVPWFECLRNVARANGEGESCI